MKVISIIQPWATLIAIGAKQYETRSWATKYRGELGIHASKKIAKAVCEHELFKTILANHGYTVNNLPTGVIIAKSFLSHCYEVTSNHGHIALLEYGDVVVEENELHFGDYSEGRFAWELMSVKQIEPIPAKGQLGLWNWEELKCQT